MSVLRAVYAVFAATALSTLLASAPARACSCAYPSTPPDGTMQDGAIAALGTVLDRQGGADSAADGLVPTLTPVVYRFTVRKTLGGDLPEEIDLRTAPDSAMCGVELPQDRETMVLLYPAEGGLYSVNLCGQLTIEAHDAAWRALFEAQPD